MDIAIGGRKVEVSEPLRQAVTEKVSRLGRYVGGMERAEVLFSEERNPRISERDVCEVTMFGHGHIVRARAAAPDQQTRCLRAALRRKLWRSEELFHLTQLFRRSSH